MIDESEFTLSEANLRTLMHNLGQELDQRVAFLRRGTAYEKVRPSDVRVFVYIALGTGTISDVARVLGVSRQAVHLAVKRLQKLGTIALEPGTGDKREKRLVLTDRGREAAKLGQQLTLKLDAELAETIGREGVETLRKTLLVLLQQTRSRNREAGFTPRA
jgi:DNA-binding MarR family transcriptional regulator